MKTKVKVMVLVLVAAALAAVSGEALELRAAADSPRCCNPQKCKPVYGCCGQWLVVDPAYKPPLVGGVPAPDPCVVVAIPANAQALAWVATELWEMPPQVSEAEKASLGGPPTFVDGQWVYAYDGWTRLTCGATKDGSSWSFSCFDAGVIGIEGLFTGTAAQLDATVRTWWQAQR